MSDGAAAVERMKRANIDAAVLVSSGRAMDRTETALNLRDINPSMEIIIIAGRKLPGNKRPEIEVIGPAISNTRVLTARQLEDYLISPKWRGVATARGSDAAKASRKYARHHPDK